MKRNVALLIETAGVYGRGILAGIVRFMRMHDCWTVLLEQRDLLETAPQWLEDWSGDGIITRITDQWLQNFVRKAQLPIVELTDRQYASDLVQVRSDDLAIGRMAATHLLERGLRHFGYCGYEGEAWSDRRRQGFADVLAEVGFDCAAYQSAFLAKRTLLRQQQQRHLQTWVDSLPKPCGIFCANDLRGKEVIDASVESQLAVPENVAVIGVDDDQLLCLACDTPLTSVIPDLATIGYRAAELLSAMMEGEEVGTKEVLLEPIGIAIRQSTDLVAVDDPPTAAALQFMRQNAIRGISVQEVAEAVAVSRSTLERKIRGLLGRSPQQEIRRVQIAHAQELLATTDLTTNRIAELCGFEHVEYFHVVFRRVAGMTPGVYREKSRKAFRL